MNVKTVFDWVSPSLLQSMSDTDRAKMHAHDRLIECQIISGDEQTQKNANEPESTRCIWETERSLGGDNSRGKKQQGKRKKKNKRKTVKLN